jgi:nucleoid DNA-binding protein
MSGKFSIPELTDDLVVKAGITRKLAEDWLRILPAIIEEGLVKDGEVRIRGLGTFKLKWVDRRVARNLKTGEEVEVPAHSRVVFTPEPKLKDRINEDFKYLSYRVIEEPAGEVKTAVDSQHSATGSPEPEIMEKPALPDLKPAAVSQQPTEIATAEVTGGKRKVHWLIPLVFLVIVILAVVFYFRNCRGPLIFTPPPSQPELELKPSVPAGDTGVAQPDTVGQEPLALDVQEDSASQAMPTINPPEQPQRQTTDEKQQTEIVTRGTWLFQLAREQYGNPFLWTLIYAGNKALIGDPQKVPDGITLVIPSLEGTGRSLTHGDSLRVAEGYRLVAEYYDSLGNTRQASEYRQGVSRFSPK